MASRGGLITEAIFFMCTPVKFSSQVVMMVMTRPMTVGLRKGYPDPACKPIIDPRMSRYPAGFRKLDVRARFRNNHSGYHMRQPPARGQRK